MASANLLQPLAISLAVLCGACTSGSQAAAPAARAADAAQALSVPPHDTSCEPPAPGSSLRLESIPDARKLAGMYELTVVADKNAADSIVRGRLELWPTDPAHRHPPNEEITFLLQGATDVELTRLGSVSLAHSPDSRDPLRPGVLVEHYRGKLELWMGNSSGFNDEYTTDSGVLFTVAALDDAGFRGYWKDGGLYLYSPSGHFCARRVSQ